MAQYTTTHESQIQRLNRIEGQVRGIRKMIEDRRYCVDILTQLRSVINALHRVQENIFQRHLETCVQDSLKGEDPHDKKAKIDEVIDLVSRFRNR